MVAPGWLYLSGCAIITAAAADLSPDLSLILSLWCARSIDSICTNWLLKSVNLALAAFKVEINPWPLATRSPSIRDYFAVSRLQRGPNCGSISQDYMPAAPRGRLSLPICLLFAHPLLFRQPIAAFFFKYHIFVVETRGMP
jgi:hypothetical protein